jgi:hypothetical protein
LTSITKEIRLAVLSPTYLIVENTVIVELKAINDLAKVHEVQLVNYLVATGKPIGLLINFGPNEVEVHRKVRELKHHPPHPVILPILLSCRSCYPADPVILPRTDSRSN